MINYTPRSRTNVFDVFTQNLGLECNENEYSDSSDADDPQYEPGWVDTDLSDENDDTYSRSKFPKFLWNDKKSWFLKIHIKKKLINILDQFFLCSIKHDLNFLALKFYSI